MSDELNHTFRTAASGDVPLVRCFLDPYFAEHKLLPRSDDELRKLTEHGFIAEQAGEVVGFAAIEVYSRKMAEIQCLAVAPRWQGRGLGKQLIQLCVNRARELGIHELMAITSSEKPFTDCGFDYALPDQKRALFIHPQNV